MTVSISRERFEKYRRLKEDTARALRQTMSIVAQPLKSESLKLIGKPGARGNSDTSKLSHVSLHSADKIQAGIVKSAIRPGSRSSPSYKRCCGFTHNAKWWANSELTCTVCKTIGLKKSTMSRRIHWLHLSRGIADRRNPGGIITILRNSSKFDRTSGLSYQVCWSG